MHDLVAHGLRGHSSLPGPEQGRLDCLSTVDEPRLGTSSWIDISSRRTKGRDARPPLPPTCQSHPFSSTYMLGPLGKLRVCGSASLSPAFCRRPSAVCHPAACRKLLQAAASCKWVASGASREPLLLRRQPVPVPDKLGSGQRCRCQQ